MKVCYFLEKNDHLIFQLYQASKSERIRKKRFHSQIRPAVIYWIAGLYFFWRGSVWVTLFLIIVGVLWFIYYPLWERGHYVRHYQSFIDEKFPAKSQVESEVNLDFDETYIHCKNYLGESKVLLSAIQEIIELDTLILIKLSDAESVILPKERIENIDEVKSYLKTLAERLNIPYQQELDWQWK